jgi:hypothetical protein
MVVFVCLCGQCLEDSSSHCSFLKNNSFEHIEQAFLTVSIFGHLEFACTRGFTKT